MYQSKYFATLTFLMIFAVTSFDASAKTFRDKDWNVTLKPSCALPKRDSATFVKIGSERKLKVQLKPGQIGKCSTDNVVRHGAQYWERAEVISQIGNLRLGRTYEISFTVDFLSGFTSRRETFFQIHAWNGKCSAYPPLMMGFHNGKLEVKPLQNVGPKAGTVWISSENGGHVNSIRKSIKIQNLIGKTSEFRIIADIRKRGSLTVFLNGQKIVDKAKMEVAACGKPYTKFGVYRPGPATGEYYGEKKGSGPTKTSAVLLDKVRIERLK